MPLRSRLSETSGSRTPTVVLGEDTAGKYESLSELLEIHFRREATEVTPRAVAW